MTSLYTIGYEAADLDKFVATLAVAGIEVLADVRELPLSRRKGFSKNALKDRLALAGIEYIHLKQLGDPKPGRDAAKRGDIETFRCIFDEHMDSEASKAAIEGLAELAESNITCIMCFERDPKHCHRKIVTELLTNQGITAFDLFVDKLDYYERHPFKLPSNNSSESASAA